MKTSFLSLRRFSGNNPITKPSMDPRVEQSLDSPFIFAFLKRCSNVLVVMDLDFRIIRSTTSVVPRSLKTLELMVIDKQLMSVCRITE
jgi:hypothetical protein